MCEQQQGMLGNSSWDFKWCNGMVGKFLYLFFYINSLRPQSLTILFYNLVGFIIFAGTKDVSPTQRDLE